MAIVVKLDELLHQQRMSLTELAGQIDITLANLSILKTGKARAIRFSTLEAICEALQLRLLCSQTPELSVLPMNRVAENFKESWRSSRY